MSAVSAARNLRTGIVLAGVAVGMVGLSFASVPLYRLFCQVTGFGGTTQVADAVPGAVGERVIKVRFDAGVNPTLPWSFEPIQRELSLRVGESGLAVYRARNLAAEPATGTAIFNVTPLKAGKYFSKVQCFCFDEQRLEPGEEVDMAVQFFVDPAILDDRNLDEVKTITLSYTFYRAPGEGQAAGPRRLNTASGAPARRVVDIN